MQMQKAALEQKLETQQATVVGLTGVRKVRDTTSKCIEGGSSAKKDLQSRKAALLQEIGSSTSSLKEARKARAQKKVELKDADAEAKDALKAELVDLDKAVVEAEGALAALRAQKGEVEQELIALKTSAAQPLNEPSVDEAVEQPSVAEDEQPDDEEVEEHAVSGNAAASSSKQASGDGYGTKFADTLKKKRRSTVAQTSAPKKLRKGIVEAQCDKTQSRL